MKPPSLYRMVYNDHATEVLDRYKTNRFTRQQALTELNKILDYVIISEADEKRRPKKN